MGCGWEIALGEWPEKVLSVGFWGHQDHIKEGGEKAERGHCLPSFAIFVLDQIM